MLNGVDLEDAHRAVPEDGPRCGDLGRDRARSVAGPDVDALHAGGDRRRRPRAGAPPSSAVGDDVVDGQEQRRRRAPWRARASSARRRSRSLLDAASRRRRLPLRAEERVGHGAADQERVAPASSRLLDDADLVGDLGAAEDGDERPLRVARVTFESASTSFCIRKPAARCRRRGAPCRRSRRGRGARRRRRR